MHDENKDPALDLSTLSELEVTLETPIQLDGKECKKLVMRKPKAKERYDAISRAGKDAVVNLVLFETILLCVTGEVSSRAAIDGQPDVVRRVSVPRNVLEQLSWADSVNVENKMFAFLGSVM